MKIICPDCGADITKIVLAVHEEIMFDIRSKGGAKSGAMRTAKQIDARKTNMEKLNIAYTPEKRRAAAQKRLATLAAKKQKATKE